ncbi:MAG TPA: hypothetical protein VHG08_05035 [Longimicrobium sp.]|nr:hypothetical protein [Longimicrobium sp.]
MIQTPALPAAERAALWRAHAEVLRTYGAEHIASVLEACARLGDLPRKPGAAAETAANDPQYGNTGEPQTLLQIARAVVRKPSNGAE